MQRFARNRPPPGRRRANLSTRAMRSPVTTPKLMTNSLTTTPPKRKRKRKPTTRKRRKRKRPTRPIPRLTMKIGGRGRDVVTDPIMGLDMAGEDMAVVDLAVDMAPAVVCRERAEAAASELAVQARAAERLQRAVALAGPREIPRLVLGPGVQVPRGFRGQVVRRQVVRGQDTQALRDRGRVLRRV